MISSLMKMLFSSSDANSVIRSITPAALKEKLRQQPETQLLDVRGVEESKAAGTIKGSLVAPLHSPAMAKAATTLSKDMPLVIFCRSGARSRMACNYFAEQGFTEIHNLAGGHGAWQAEMRS